ncbi:MAG TPA: YceI family protein [Armatimonadaceae bacterium]|nr:YceI family protein [Armatimonadaceae bacterium]
MSRNTFKTTARRQRTLIGTTTAAALALGLGLASGWNAPELRAQTPAATVRTAAVAAAQASVPLTGTWNIDTAHTNVNFAIGHMGISTVRGRFDEVAGTIVADAANPEKSSVQVTIQTASIDTDVKMRDDHLRSPDFFDAAKYPQITFRSTRVEKAANGGGFVAHGDLTMHGVTKRVALPFKVAGPIKDSAAGGRIGVETRLRLNRQDYGIKYHQALDNGALAVANDVDVTISLEAVPAKTATASK